MKQRIEGMQKRLWHTAGLLLLAAGFVLAGPNLVLAAEVYTWTDKDGVTHYSDFPPAEGQAQTIELEEAYRPGTGDAYATPGSDTREADSGESTDKAESAAQQRRDDIAKNRNERRENQAVVERLCNLHRQRLEQVEPARRVFFTNDQGESVRMDDDQRIALVEESKAYIEKNCE